MVYESMHKRRLQKLRVRIVTTYYDDGLTKRRSSDGTLCDDVTNAVILDKKYELAGRSALQETEFNPGILYSFVYPETEDGKLHCPSCGGVADRDDFSEGCPYCGAAGNLEYAERKAGERDHADYVVNRSARNVFWLLLFIAIGVGTVLPLTVLFSRTKLPMDFVKGAAIGLFLGLIAFLVRQYILSKTDIRNSERIKQIRQDTVLQAFTEDLDREGLTLKAFHNGLSAELNRYFYESEDKSLQTVADYDILDFSNQRIEETADGKQLTVQVQLRVIKASGSHMTSELGWYRITMRMESKDRTVLLHGGLNMIECPNCGAKVNVEQPNCMYCGSPVTFMRLLTLTSIRRIEDPEA